MKIAHLSVVRKLSQGQTKQLLAEQSCANELADVTWDTFALQESPAHAPFILQMPRFFKGPILRNLYGWLEIRRLSREYDYVLVRQMPIDICCLLFARTVRNRVSVHHSMETEEHLLIGDNWRRRLATHLDRRLIRHAVRRAATVLGVTRQIAEYERDRYDPGKPVGIYPNAISKDAVSVLGDARDRDKVTVTFICGTFTAWHGLDRLIDAIDADPELAEMLTVHLVGPLSESQNSDVTNTELRRKVFVIHGRLEPEGYERLLEKSDLGLGSLALDRQNMIEGSSLKTAELLASGLPVYATHYDASLPKDFPYFYNDETVNISNIVKLAQEFRDVARSDVAAAALPFVEKSVSMNRVVEHLRTLNGPKA